jgi:biotin carboxyl carrier protein
MPVYEVIIEGQTYVVDVPDPQARPVRAVVDGEVFEVEVQPSQNEAVQPAVTRPEPAAAPAPPAAKSAPTPSGTGGEVTSPLPGTIVSINVSEGDTVSHGQELFVLEAMKMNNPIRATQAGVVEEILVAVGEQVQHGAPLMVIAEA